MRYMIANAAKDIDALTIDDVMRLKTVDGAAGLLWKDELTASKLLAESGLASTMFSSLDSCRAFFLFMGLLLALACGPGAMAADIANLPPQDLSLIKAVRAGDASLVADSLAQGALLERAEYGPHLRPLQLAFTFNRPELLPLLLKTDKAVEEAFIFSVLFQNPQALKTLLATHTAPDVLLKNGFTIFAGRASPKLIEFYQSISNVQLEGKEPSPEEQDQGPWWDILVPVPLQSATAPELALVQTLYDLGARGGEMGKDHPLSGAAAVGDVFYADWLVDHGIGALTEDLKQKLLVGTVFTGFEAGFELLIQRKYVPSSLPEGGVELLMIAAGRGKLGLVRRLLGMGIPPDGASPAMKSIPLLAAVEGGHEEIAIKLLGGGAKPDARSATNWPLREATRSGRVGIVSALLQAGAAPNLVDNDGNTVLHELTLPEEEGALFMPRRTRLITQGHFKATAALAKAGFDMNAKNKKGVSVLGSMVGTRRIATDYWTALVENGARPDESAYLAVVSEYDLEPARANWFFNVAAADPNYVISKPVGMSLVEYTASRYAFGTMEALLKMGAGAPTEPKAQVEVMQRLLAVNTPSALATALARGVSPNLDMGKGESALEHALRWGNTNHVRLLLEAGANANVASYYSQGGSLLHAMVDFDTDKPGEYLDAQRLMSVSLLVEHGLNLGSVNKNGKTVFQLAPPDSKTGAAIVDAIAKATTTADPVHSAVRKGHLASIQNLVSAGAGMEVADSLGRTPLSIALANGQIAIAKYLLRKGAAIGWKEPTPGIRSDLSYATDERYIAMFHPRLVSRQLVDDFGPPNETLSKIAANTAFSLAPVNWTTGCKNGCEGAEYLQDTSRDFFDNVRSERTDSAGRSVALVYVRYRSEDEIQGSNLAASVLRRVIRESVWTLRGTWGIAECAFTFAQPHCYPEVGIELDGSDGVVAQIKEGAALVSELKKGEKYVVDRSANKIEIAVNPIEGRRPFIQVSLTYSERPKMTLIPGADFIHRMNNYSELTRMHAEKDALLIKGDRASLMRAKTLATAIREYSATVKKQNYPVALMQLFKLRGKDVAALDQRVVDLRKVLQAQLAFPPEELQAVVLSIDALIAGDPGLQEKLGPIRDVLKAAVDASTGGQAAVGTALQNLFDDVDRVILEYQGFGLELAQFMSTEQIESEGVASADRPEIQKRVAPFDVLITDQSFGGRGAKLKRALALP